MVYQKSVILAYAAENQETAKQLHQQLSPSEYQFDHYICENETDATSLFERISASNQPVIMLVSDNFLKSSQCMADGLKMLQTLGGNNRILPIIIDGKVQNEDTGEWETTTTRFERVSDVIQYMNFWQNQYLDLRKQKRNIEPEQEESFNNQLKLVRSISSEVGEYLRQLRVTPNYSLEEFSNNDFEIFFRFANDLGAHTAFKQAPKDIPTEVEVEAGGTQLMTDLAPQFPEEVPEVPEVPEVLEEEVEVEEDSQGDVPGTEILDDTPSVESVVDESATVILERPIIIGEPPAEPDQDDSERVEEAEDQSIPLDIGDSSNDDDLVEGESAETYTADLSHLVQEESAEEEDDDEEPAFPDEEEEEDEWEVEQEEAVADTPQANIDLDDDDEEEEDDDEEDEEDFDDHDEEEEEDEEDDDDEEDIEIDPEQNAYNHPIQLVERAKAFIENGALESGLNLYKEGIRLFPDETSIRFQYGMALLKYKDQKAEARGAFEEILEIDSNHEHTHFILGELAEIDHDFESARNHYEEVAGLNAHFPKIFYRLGLLSIQHFEDEVERSAGYFEKAIKADKYNADAHYQYAILLSERLDEPGKSIKHFKKTLKYQKHHPFANYDLAVIYHQLGEQNKAFKYYNRAISINPELRTPENEEAFKVPEPVAETPIAAPVEATPEEVEIPKDKTIADTQGIVLITGATSGIGKATAYEFAKNNYSLLLTGRRQDRLDAIATELNEQYGVPVSTKVFDVRDLEAAKANIEDLDEEWSQIDILINNAGLAKGFAPIHEGSIDHWETMIDTNIKGLLYMTRLVSPGMVERGAGHIINVGSTAGKEVYPNGNVYCASKFAVDALTKSMRLDFYKHGLRVSQVSPAHVEETEFAEVRFDGDKERAKIYEDFQPLKSSDVAAVIHFIASQPAHVNIQDVLMMGRQQAGSTYIDRSGRGSQEED